MQVPLWETNKPKSLGRSANFESNLSNVYPAGMGCYRPARLRTHLIHLRLDSLCDVLHTYGLDFGLHLRHLRDEYTRKEVGDYYAAMCPISHNVLLCLEAVVNRWTKRVTRGLIGRVRSANICGGRKLHKYVSTNVWTMKKSAHSKCHGVYVIWRYNPGPLRCAGYFRVETSMVGCHVTNRQAVMSGHRRSAVWLIEAIMHMYSCINATKHLKTQK